MDGLGSQSTIASEIMASSGDENDHFFDEEKVELDDVKEVLSENDQDPNDSSDTSNVDNHT